MLTIDKYCFPCFDFELYEFDFEISYATQLATKYISGMHANSRLTGEPLKAITKSNA